MSILYMYIHMYINLCLLYAYISTLSLSLSPLVTCRITNIQATTMPRPTRIPRIKAPHVPSCISITRWPNVYKDPFYFSYHQVTYSIGSTMTGSIYVSCIRCIGRKCSKQEGVGPKVPCSLSAQTAETQRSNTIIIRQTERIFKAHKESNQEHKGSLTFCISFSEGLVSPTVICLFVFQAWCVGSWLTCILPPSSPCVCVWQGGLFGDLFCLLSVQSLCLSC